ncbi:MAG: 16S rRNA (guanine(527)-N(7))-methyltransferase RsmG [Anaerolineales bacterium]|nr:MAG: 16S rRNA (guanine(527)-N(7))-methyltransferase RsmG [Anaerolineales bacterium]
MNEFADWLQFILDVQVTPASLSALVTYENELLAWNERMNLTAIKEPGVIWVKHFLDSLTCLLAMRNTPMERVIDIGTGAGFPGLPLKIVCPSMQLTLVESVGKKAAFCRHMVQVLDLKDVEVVQERAEVLGQDPRYRESYDWAVTRAVAMMPVLAEYQLPLVRLGGSMLAMKGENASAEVHMAENALRLMGGHFQRLIPITLPGVADQRYLVVINKNHATPQKYPRRPGMPAKKPL